MIETISPDIEAKPVTKPTMYSVIAVRVIDSMPIFFICQIFIDPKRYIIANNRLITIYQVGKVTPGGVRLTGEIELVNSPIGVSMAPIKLKITIILIGTGLFI